MAKSTLLGMSKQTLVQGLSASAALFGVVGVLAPQAMEAAYGVPSSPHTRALLRVFGSRQLALAAWAYTARTKEETDRMLAASVGMNLLDVLTTLASAQTVGRATVLPGALTSGTFAALCFAVRSMED